MRQLKQGDKVALVALSNGLSRGMEGTIGKLVACLEAMGLEVIQSPLLYAPEGLVGHEAKLRAHHLNMLYKEEMVEAIFDVSGGDIANEVLKDLDYESIRKSQTDFFGYSDLTTVINALYTKANKTSYLYQIRHIVGSSEKVQRQQVQSFLLEGSTQLLETSYEWIQGNHMEGVVLGGNIRCLLKLAGTPYMPDFKGKLLFLESRSGGVAQMVTFLNQYQQLGILDDIQGLILGCFSQMEKEALTPSITELVANIVVRRDLPIAKTSGIGHEADSKALGIGKWLALGC